MPMSSGAVAAETGRAGVSVALDVVAMVGGDSRGFCRLGDSWRAELLAQPLNTATSSDRIPIP